MHSLNLITAMVHLAAAAELTKDAEGASEWETSNADDAGGLMLSFVLAVRVDGFKALTSNFGAAVTHCYILGEMGTESWSSWLWGWGRGSGSGGSSSSDGGSSSGGASGSDSGGGVKGNQQNNTSDGGSPEGKGTHWRAQLSCG